MSATPRPRRTPGSQPAAHADDDALVRLELTSCAEPGCGLPAEITNRFVLESTRSPVEHVSTSCVARHHLRMPSAMLLDAHR